MIEFLEDEGALTEATGVWTTIWASLESDQIDKTTKDLKQAPSLIAHLEWRVWAKHLEFVWHVEQVCDGGVSLGKDYVLSPKCRTFPWAVSVLTPELLGL